MPEKRINLRYRQRRATLFGVLLLLIAIPVIYSTTEQVVGHVIGWLILASSLWLIGKVNRVALDDSGEHLVHQRGFVVPFLNKRFARQRIKGVRVGARSTGSGENEGTRFPITLRGIADSVILDHRAMWFSRVIAERLARLLEVPLDNRVWGESSVRDFDELDTPLMERWRREGKTFDRPSPPVGTAIREQESPTTYGLSYPAQFPKLKYAVVACFVAAALAIVDVGASNVFHTTAYRLVASVLVLVAILMMSFIGRSRLTIDESRFTYRQGLFLLRQKIAMGEVEEMFIQFDGIGFIGDRSAVWINWSGSKDDNEYIAAVVPYQLARIGRSLNPSMTS